jgi:hypothetical protein
MTFQNYLDLFYRFRYHIVIISFVIVAIIKSS